MSSSNCMVQGNPLIEKKRGQQHTKIPDGRFEVLLVLVCFSHFFNTPNVNFLVFKVYIKDNMSTVQKNYKIKLRQYSNTG